MTPCPQCGAPPVEVAGPAPLVSCGTHAWPADRDDLVHIALTSPSKKARDDALAELVALDEPEQQVTGTASTSRLALTLDGRTLTGEDIGGPGERWICEVGGRVVGTTSGAGQASIALRWLLTGDGLT